MASTLAKKSDIPEGVRAELAAIDTIAQQLGVSNEFDPSEISKAITDKVMEAESLDDLFANETLSLTEQVLERPFIPLSVKLLPSEQYGGFFAVLDIKLASGETFVATTGALSVVLKLAKMAQKSWLGDTPVVVRGKLAKSGNDVYDLYRFPLDQWKAEQEREAARAADPERF